MLKNVDSGEELLKKCECFVNRIGIVLLLKCESDIMCISCFDCGGYTNEENYGYCTQCVDADRIRSL